MLFSCLWYHCCGQELSRASCEVGKTHPAWGTDQGRGPGPGRGREKWPPGRCRESTVTLSGHHQGGCGPGSPTSAEAAPSPAGYYVGMCFAASEKRLYSPSQAPEAWRLFLLLAVTLPTISWTLIYYWSRDRWARHPLARTLALYALPQSGWQAVASSVDTEFRRIDKFATGAPGARVIVTDTWVMKVTTYRVHVAQQQDVHLTVTESQQHELSPDSNLPVQLLTIRVASVIPAVQAFDIR